jgi:fructose/tagatose bisphosphate aldolase
MLKAIYQMMNDAQVGKYAVGYFESWNFESLQGVIDAAERTQSPVIIGFSGDFLSQRAGATEEDLSAYGAMGRAIAEQARVPCGLIFNECSRDSWVQRAITSGFNLVMPADSDAPSEDYARRVMHLTKLAHAHGVAVEGDVEYDSHGDAFSYADYASQFVQATGVDLLAISVGNEEIRLAGSAPLDMTRLKAVHERVRVPLVLHGGTGIEEESLRQAIRLGVCKVNYGTYIKQRYLPAIREVVNSAEVNPHALVGGGSATDMMVIGRAAVRDAVLERIDLLGCCGRA